MPPDSSRVSRRSMHQRNSFSGGDLRTRFASHQTGPQTLPHNNGHDSRERRTSSRKTRDLVVAVSAICLVSYFLSFFQPASFDGSELFLYQHSPVVVPSSQQDAPSDDVIQVVNTRFQQNQPHFKTLGRARLELFKAFCLPSMIRQSNQNFLWLIQTDPELDDELMNEMKRLLAPYPHFYLIKSKNIKKWPITRNWKVRKFNETNIISGDKAALVKAYEEAPDKILIETNLDADDGLAYYVLQDIRDDTMRRLESVAKQYLSVRKNGWVVTCYHQFIGWYPEVHKAGDAIPPDTSGGLRIDFRHDMFCPTPALTIASVPKANYSHVPVTQHDNLVKQVPRCKADDDTMCLHGVGEIPSSVRARTPSSAGMNNIGEKVGKKENVQHLWAYLDHLFGIHRGDVANAGRYFLENSKAIARENLEGLCVPGTYTWTCKKDVQAKLKKLIEEQEREEAA